MNNLTVGGRILQIKGKVVGERVHLVEQEARTVWLKIRIKIKNGRK